MLASAESIGARRVVVGLDGAGRSAVVSDAPTSARTIRPNGAIVEEIWRQEHLPARVADDGIRTGEMAPMPPPKGATVRMFTLPPDRAPTPSGEAALPGSLGELNVRRSADPPTLNRTASMYVATVISGEAYVVLEAGEVLLRPGDSLVLPGCLHAWRNETKSPAAIVTVVFPLDGDGDGDR
jgi:hypothetical protein